MAENTLAGKAGQDEPLDPDDAEQPPPAPPVPAGAWDPNTPPTPTGAWDPNTPPTPTGAWDPNIPPRPTGAWDPNRPPAPTGAWDPNTNGAVSANGWTRNRAITHLWSYNASPGVWVAVHGIGWKRLSPASESGHSHLTMLALLAKSNGLAVSYHEDAHGQIDQLVV
ncbi:MAG: hypothetical protein GEU98_23495 [Pseudonocardiaceae bacterium]|nr:hypothetical protein [Pseudonocardiaceae bacterium]